MSIELNTLFQQDCLKGLKQIVPGTVDLAFADPPFNIGYKYDNYNDKQKRDRYLNWTREWTKAVVDVLKPTGTFWVAIGDEYAAEMKLILQDDLGLICRNWVVWYYTFGVHCKYKFTRSHAHLFYFVKDAKKFTFNTNTIRVPSARQLVYADRRAEPGGRVPDDTWILRPQDLAGGFRPDQDTWYFSRVCGTFKERQGWHGCQMPERLLGRIIEACSCPQETVLDPFAGSGTTLAVAKKLHRKWLGFEISAKYVRHIKKRLERIRPDDPLDGAEYPLTSTPSSVAGRRLRQAPQRRSLPSSPKGIAAEGRVPDCGVIRPLSSSLGQIAAGNGEFTTAIAQAYLTASDGYSTDRVLADPDLNREFRKACRDLRIPGEEEDWNRRLLGLRKAGKLKALPRPRRTSLRWDELDRFIFASEMAWRIIFMNRDVSLDDILCDPILASQFDKTARRFAPGWTPFHYRWGALTLRKKGAEKKRSAKRSSPTGNIDRKFRGRPVDVDNVPGLPESAGLYLLETPGTKLYLGETDSLRTTIAVQAAQLEHILRGFQLPVSALPAARWRHACLGNHDRNQRWGEQSRRLGTVRPLGNVLQLQALSL